MGSILLYYCNPLKKIHMKKVNQKTSLVITKGMFYLTVTTFLVILILINI